MNVHIIKGVNGSGKSTYAAQLVSLIETTGDTHSIIELNDFLRDENGRVDYSGEKVVVAYRQCYDAYCKLIDQGIQHVIVTSNNGDIIRYRNYLSYAKERGYNVFVACMEPHHELKPSTDVNPKVLQRIIQNFKVYVDGKTNAARRKIEDKTKQAHTLEVKQREPKAHAHKPTTERKSMTQRVDRVELVIAPKTRPDQSVRVGFSPKMVNAIE